MEQLGHISYKDFLIWADSWLLSASGKWRGRVNIMRKKGNIIEHFDIENTFETKQEVIDHSIEYGRMIIDGKIPGCLIKDT
jgi:hypothetical protein